MDRIGQQDSLLDALEGTMIIDPSGRVILANRTIERLFGHTSRELVGHSVSAMLTEGVPQPDAEADIVWTRRVRGRTRSGEPIMVDARFARMGDFLVATLRPVGSHDDRIQQCERELAVERARSQCLEREQRYLRAQVRRLEGHGEIVGASAAINLLHAQIAAVARTNAAVLISGEPGVGKRLVARAIHAARHRDAPFVEADVRATADVDHAELIEERITVAMDGSLVVREVGALSLEQQRRLLARMEHLDASLVATTTTDLRNAVLEGRFVEELYYRLAIHPLRVPPLRRRASDIPLLASHFWGDAIPPDVGDVLAAQPWPGNVRELKAVIERASVVARRTGEKELTLSSLNLGNTVGSSNANPQNEAQAIRATLQHHSGNIQQSAKALGLSRQALYRRIQKHGIRR